jgi:hypothetical protein
VFAILDFTIFPLKCCPNEILLSFVVAHGVRSLADNERSTLERKVQELEGKTVVPPSRVPIQIRKWSVVEQLEPVDGEDWTNDNWFTIVKSMLLPIVPAHFAQFYPNGDESILNRAAHLFDHGNYDISTISSRACLSRKDGSSKLLFRCVCLPSQKSDNKSKASKKKATSSGSDTGTGIGPSTDAPNFYDEDDDEESGYLVYLCFDSHESCDILDFPYSCCGCPNGRGFCSHCLGLLLLFHVIQTEATNLNEFSSVYPESPKTTQKFPMLIELLLSKEQVCRSKGQKKRRKS